MPNLEFPPGGEGEDEALMLQCPPGDLPKIQIHVGINSLMFFAGWFT